MSVPVYRDVMIEPEDFKSEEDAKAYLSCDDEGLSECPDNDAGRDCECWRVAGLEMYGNLEDERVWVSHYAHGGDITQYLTQECLERVRRLLKEKS